MRWLFLGAVGTRWNSARLRWSPHAQWEDGHFSEGEVGKFAFRFFIMTFVRRLLYGDFCAVEHNGFRTEIFLVLYLSFFVIYASPFAMMDDDFLWRGKSLSVNFLLWNIGTGGTPE